MITLGSSVLATPTKAVRILAADGLQPSSYRDTANNHLDVAPRMRGLRGFVERTPGARREHGRRLDAVARPVQYGTATRQGVATEAMEIDWDDVADVVCAGPGAGGLAAAIAAADAGLDVVVADGAGATVAGTGSLAHRLGLFDVDTIAYLDALTQDLQPLSGHGWDTEVAVRVLGNGSLAGNGSRQGAPTFFGSRLKDWASSCLESPYGVLFSRVFDRNMVPAYTGAGESIEVAVIGSLEFDPDQPSTALTEWLMNSARERKIQIRQSSSLQRMVFDGGGQVVGAVIAEPNGERAVRARRGVVMATGGNGVQTAWPTRRNIEGKTVEVAVVSRPASRFAEVELLASPASCSGANPELPLQISRDRGVRRPKRSRRIRPD